MWEMMLKVSSVQLCYSHLISKVTKTVHCINSSPLYTYCVQYVCYNWIICFLPSVVWFTCTGCYKSIVTTIIIRSKQDTLLFAAGHHQNVQQFLKLSPAMFNVYWVINDVVFPLNVSIILINHPYNTWYYNYLTSWTVYIKSWSQRILTVLLYEAYHHQHQHIPPGITPFPSCRSVLFTTILIAPPPLNSRVPNSAL